MLHYKILPYLNPEQIYVQVASVSGVIYLDSSLSDHHYGRYSYILLNPLVEYVSEGKSFTTDFVRWAQLISRHQQIYNPELPPFTAGLAGYFSYDLCKQLESIPSVRSINIPDYHLGLYNQVFAFDHIEQKCFAMVSELDGFQLDYAKQMQALIQLYNQAKPVTKLPDLPSLLLNSNYTKAEYMVKVQKAREHILDGDIFEVNLSQCFSARIQADYPVDLLYRRLREINPAPFSAYLNMGEVKILSASPERFISIKNRHIETRPIKGTCKRSSDPDTDRQLADNLRNSSKDRAENIMIVDLMRNDLGKICRPSSIKVSQLCGVESFTNLHHLVSVIEGELNPDSSILDVLIACFPGGSITGAPKIRSMQLIEELESHNRGVYCGSIGYFGFNGNVDLSIAIRTLVTHEETLTFQVGGAVTLGSDPEAEYNETLVKGQKLIEAISY